MIDPLLPAPPGKLPAEDHFFVLRDCRELFQKRLAEAVQRVGVASPPLLQSFVEALGEVHDELAASRQNDAFGQTHGLTSSRITLMCDSDLELEIRIGDIARRLSEHAGKPLWRVHHRYMTLLHRQEMARAENPVGPEAVCESLWALCRSSDSSLERKLEQLDRIEAQLTLSLPAIYDELNDLLTVRGVEPAQSPIGSLPLSSASSSSFSSTSSSASATAARGRPDPLAGLQDALSRQFAGAEGVAASSPATQEGTAGGQATLNAATLLMLNQLAARLDQIDFSTLAPGAASAHPADSPRTLKSAEVGVPLARNEAVALDTLALIFDAIFEIWELPDTVKTAIGRLQIPFLRLAMADPTLFSDSHHPARRLINGMARATIGLPRDIGRSHPVSAQLWQLAGTVADTLQGDAAVLEPFLAELDRLVAERDRKIQDAAQAFVGQLQLREARKMAVPRVLDWLRNIETYAAPPEIHRFLRDDWARVLAAACMQGEAGEALWQESLATAQDLLWSVQPKNTPEERKRLAGMAASLIRRLAAGQERIGMAEAGRAAFIDSCFKLQTNALRGVANESSLAAPSLMSIAALGEKLFAPAENETDALTILVLASPDASSDDGLSTAAAAPVGQWLQFAMHGNELLCGLVCWQSPHTGQSLLYNPDWDCAISLPAALLEQQLRTAQARIVSSQAIFDVAAAHALQQIGRS